MARYCPDCGCPAEPMDRKILNRRVYGCSNVGYEPECGIEFFTLNGKTYKLRGPVPKGFWADTRRGNSKYHWWKDTPDEDSETLCGLTWTTPGWTPERRREWRKSIGLDEIRESYCRECQKKGAPK